MKCVCPAAGYCQTHQRRMTKATHRLCRSSDGYFDAFQADLRRSRGRKGLPVKDDVGGPNDGALCVHRGEPDGDVRCTCGGGRRLAPAYLCDLHGRCCDKEAKAVAWCRWCPDFNEVTT